MNLDPTTWGTIADWVGGLATALAFGITALVIWGDIQRRRRDQASKVSYYFEIVDPASMRDNPRNDYRYHVHNYSDNTVYSVCLYHPVNVNDRLMKIDTVLLPGEEWPVRTEKWDYANMPRLAFRDADGKRWNKDKSGKLQAGWPPFRYTAQPSPEALRSLRRQTVATAIIVTLIVLGLAWVTFMVRNGGL